MNKSIDETRAFLIGGSSHTGKSTLGRALAAKLGWSYLATDKLARHPGRPWVGINGQAIPAHVVEHYRNLSGDALLLDVLSHYANNVLPQVEAIVRDCVTDRSTECLVIEGSALWPEFVANLVNDNNYVRSIWLTAREQLFRTRILTESNFDRVSQEEQYLIQKFLDRTLHCDRQMRAEIDRLGLMCIDVESISTADELFQIYFK
jgi:2-phosphoglycerate kinase